ncbi:sugar ABC transporter permease [Jiangella aurantiaca]|uniref:Sugar ABC transporter permease n=1 Tax=Jiangella aurantiaca TaxID=2530373 RepID=A0A4R5ANG8_9ACTN|nr:sugar ABC transporter permease [Jiangella aurantiaca]TDD72574.1 sugar ABC transporter permease [Jiangella aurantiaca]
MTDLTTTDAGTGGAHRPVGPARRRRASSGAPYLFMLPAMALFAAFLLAPIIYAGWLSLRASRRTGGGILGQRTEVFVGLDNYARSLSDPELYTALGRMAVYGLIVVPVMLGLALLFALLLDLPNVRLRTATRVGIFLPYAVPGVIASLLWGFLYLPRVSPIREAFDTVGLPPPDFFDPDTVILSVANIAVWGGVGFNMVVMFTALRAIPPELYDSARIDGASERQIALRIKIPLLTPVLVMTGIFSLIATLQVFTEPQILRPLTNVISSSWMPLQKIYTDAFVLNDIYSAAATSIALAGASLVLSLLVLSVMQRRAFGENQ